ncbi:hypothetical protein HU200_038250 [Digitaria exilis]|uniref:Uncharacterized protein n=1 Tax=Digitaria exilis TaxID=1010633 RepID=A0A835BE39_9POAL|nr:hypothetical protein HU200_038250 [Digitaria exilis]
MDGSRRELAGRQPLRQRSRGSHRLLVPLLLLLLLAVVDHHPFAAASIFGSITASPNVRVRALHSSAADALRQVLRRPVHGLPRRVPLRRPRRLLHAPRRLRSGHRRRLLQHVVQPEPAGLRGHGEADGGGSDVRGEPVQCHGGRRRDHLRRGGRRVRQGDPSSQALAR